MALAQIGPLTGGMEALATAVGAGIVLGGLALALRDFLLVSLVKRWRLTC